MELLGRACDRLKQQQQQQQALSEAESRVSLCSSSAALQQTLHAHLPATYGKLLTPPFKTVNDFKLHVFIKHKSTC